MKKFLTILLALVMVLSMVACGAPAASSGSGSGSGSAGTSEPALKILDTEYAIEDYAICVAKDNALLADINKALGELKADGTLDAVIAYYISGEGSAPAFQQDVAADAPTLTMATNAYFPPYEYYENDKIVGIDADVAAAIADKLGMKLVISDMDFGAILAAVQTGKADMGMAGITVTDERKESVDFSDTYATGIQSVIVKSDSDIQGIDDLYNGKKIGVQENTTGDIYSTDDFGEANVQRFPKGNDAVLALKNGQVDAVIIDNEPAKAFVAAN